MGNSQSDFNDKELTPAQKQRIIEQNQLQQERIKNQILEGKLDMLQNLIRQTNQDNNLYKRSNNPLLTNPNLQQEFFKDKRKQKQLYEYLIKAEKERQDNDPNLNNQQYSQINDFLKQLNLKEDQEIDERKPYLYMNQGTKQYDFKEGEERKMNIGTSNQERDRYMRELKRQKQEQEEKMKQEQQRKKQEYESKLYNIEEDSIDAYKVLEIPKTATLNQARKAFKTKAKIYHPDKFNGNDTQFKIIVKAFTKLVEEFKRKEADKQFNVLKDESRRELEKQKNNSKKNRINMDGRNFNQKLFNKVFDDNRMYSPNDEGYGKWSSENEFTTDKIEKNHINNNFTLNSFNDNFQSYKRKNQKKNEIIKYKQPEALLSCKTNYQELGQGNITDFSDKNYTDYKKAHTETTLIDIDSINHKEYRSVDELKRERGKKMYLTREEMEQIEMDKMLEKQRDEERIKRLNNQDNLAFKQFDRVNQMFLRN